MILEDENLFYIQATSIILPCWIHCKSLAVSVDSISSPIREFSQPARVDFISIKHFPCVFTYNHPWFYRGNFNDSKKKRNGNEKRESNRWDRYHVYNYLHIEWSDICPLSSISCSRLKYCYTVGRSNLGWILFLGVWFGWKLQLVCAECSYVSFEEKDLILEK